MKSIKQQYIDLREGNMTQANFMRNLRMTLPQYVTNITSFEDSVRILKNKGILTEADMKESHDANIKWLEAIKDIIEDRWQNGQIKDAEYGSVMTKLAQHPEEVISQYGETSAEDAANRLLNSVAHLGSEYDPGPGEDEDFERDYDMDYEEPNEPFDMAESLKEAKDSFEGKWKTVTGKDLYDHFKEIDNLNGQEVLIGIDYEMQKNEELTKLEAQKIVIKNLKKIPNYYTNQDLSGVEGFEPDYIGGKSSNHDARQMQPLEKNLGNIVDKKMGMKPVKDVEKVKKDSDKGGETNKMEKGISLMSLIAKSVRGVQKMDATGEKMKKIVMKEGIEGKDEVDFENLMKKYDWYAEMSDDDRKWDAQQAMERQLKQIAKTIGAEKAAEIWNKYANKYAPNRKKQASFFEMKENKAAKTIFDRNDTLIKNTTKIGKGEEIEKRGEKKDKKLTKERLMKMIKEELEEIFDGMEPMDRTGLDEIDFDQIAMGDMGDNQTTQPKASFEGKWTDIKDKNEFILKFHISSSSPLVDIVARAIGSRENYAITNKDGKFYVYTFTQTANPGKPSQPFNSLEDAKKSVKL